MPIEAPPRPFPRRCLEVFQSALARSGLAACYVKAKGVRGATILMYHSIAGESESRWIDPRYRMDPVHFDRQMSFLARARRVVSMTALAAALEKGEDLPPGTVALTFDDGYLDNFRIAAPILARRGLPATIYLATAGLETGRPQWIDELYGYFRARTRDVLQLPGLDPFDLRDPVVVGQAYAEAARRLLDSASREREDRLLNLKDQLDPSEDPPRLTLTWDEARNLVREFPMIEIGGHTRDHVDLRAHGPVEARRQIDACAEDIQRETGERPLHFSFPYGRGSREAAAHLEQAGFRSAVADGAESLITPQADRYSLARIDGNLSIGRLAFVTSGAYPALSRALTGRV